MAVLLQPLNPPQTIQWSPQLSAAGHLRGLGHSPTPVAGPLTSRRCPEYPVGHTTQNYTPSAVPGAPSGGQRCQKAALYLPGSQLALQPGARHRSLCSPFTPLCGLCLVSQGCQNKVPQTGVLRTTELYCLIALEFGSLKSGCRQDSAPPPPASWRLQDRILHALLRLLATPGLPWLVAISPHHVVFSSMSHCSLLLFRTLPWDWGSTLIIEDGHISHISMCLPLITSPRPFWGSLSHLTSSRGHRVTPAFSCLVQPVLLAAAHPPSSSGPESLAG